MRVHLSISALRQTHWYEYAVRFVFGGAITAIAGLISQHYGPAIGGLFLAFPAIFPAAATLVQKRETDRKHRHGMHGSGRGRDAAALEARGTALGSIGLAAFAIVVWQFGMNFHWALLLLASVVVWAAISILAWKLNKSIRVPKRMRQHAIEHEKAA